MKRATLRQPDDRFHLRYLIHREIHDKSRVPITTAVHIVDSKFKEHDGSFFRRNLMSHFGCVNAVEFSGDGSLMTSGGDDRRILVWNVHKAIVGTEAPIVMQAEHLSNVFALAFDCSKLKIISGGNDEQVIVHDLITGMPLDYFLQEQPVFGVCADPLNSNIFSTACDDGRILIYDMRDSSSDPFCVVKLHSSFHSVMFHPVEPRLILSANAKEGAALWDVRMPKKVLLKYGRQTGEQCCMNARFNQNGSQVLALRRRLPPILYTTHSTAHLFQFNHSSYYNSCTMKSCCFGGTQDQFVMSGSDNFDLHIWEIPQSGSSPWVNEAKLILRGHRSIVNQVRYNYAHHVIASSGVEKMVKLWSPFSIPEESCWANDESGLTFEAPRKIFSHEEYIRLVLHSGHGHFSSMSQSQEVGRRNTGEDSKMMAFFDALVQRDIVGLSEDDSGEDSTYTNTVYSTQDSTSDVDVDSNISSANVESSSQSARNGSQQINSDVDGNPAMIDMDDIPVIDSDSDNSDVEPSGSNSTSRRLESSRNLVLGGFDITPEAAVELVPYILGTADQPLGTEEPNTLTNLIARREPQLRRLATEDHKLGTRAEAKSRKSSNRTSSKTKNPPSTKKNNSVMYTTAQSGSRKSSSDSSSNEDESELPHINTQRNKKCDSHTNSSQRHHREGPSDLDSPVRFRDRKKSIRTTPVYESSNNSPSLFLNEPGPSYQLVNELMIRNPHSSSQPTPQSRSNAIIPVYTSISSSSSSSLSTLSSSEDESSKVPNGSKLSNGKTLSKTSKRPKQPSSSVGKERDNVNLSNSSSSELSEKAESNQDAQSKGKNHKMTSGSYFTKKHQGMIRSQTRMKDCSHGCNQATFFNLSDSSESNLEVPLSTQRKRKKKRKLSGSLKRSKKLRLQRTSKLSNSSKLGTPSDSGIEMCKGTEPCCSKSCMKVSSSDETERPEDKDKEVKSSDNESENV